MVPDLLVILSCLGTSTKWYTMSPVPTSQYSHFCSAGFPCADVDRDPRATNIKITTKARPMAADKNGNLYFFMTDLLEGSS
jgi:hypothetical protein